MAHKTKKQLLLEIEILKKEIDRLLDENSSLWFMLDEIDKSNIANPEYFKHIQEIMDNLKEAKKVTSTEVGEA